MKKENAERLKSLMEKYDLSSKNVAKLLGINSYIIYNWRNGTAKFKEVNEYACLHKLRETYCKKAEMVEKDLKELGF
jgi:DNA-binding transcriptional regulator YiaG